MLLLRCVSPVTFQQRGDSRVISKQATSMDSAMRQPLILLMIEIPVDLIYQILKAQE